MTDIEKIIKTRHSVREFTDKKIEPKLQQELEKYINQCNKESGLNIQLVLD